MSRYKIAAGLFSLGLLVATSAHAIPSPNTLPSANGPSTGGPTTNVTFTFSSPNGLVSYSVQIFNCNETSNGATVTGDCSNEQVVGTVTNYGSLTLTYSSLAGSSLLNTTVGGQTKDMGFTELVTRIAGSNKITSTTLSLTGTTANTGLELTDVSAGETDNVNLANVGGNINTSMANGASPYTVGAQLAAPATTMTITKDFRLSSLKGTAGDAIQLTTVTQVFNVPEPASLAVLVMGIGGLIGARRRRRIAAAA